MTEPLMLTAGSTPRLNLVVVGKSGVGKSSLLNYAAGQHVFETGDGAPVTQEYFTRVDVPSHVEGINFSLFDTRGIEHDSTDEWLRTLNNEIARRDSSDDIYDWFHTIIYCIAAGDKRIEPFDVAAIRKLSELGSVIVVFTKKDQVTPAQLDDLMERARVECGGNVPVYAVCNGARTRMGDAAPEGIAEVLRGSFTGMWEKAAKILPRRAAVEATRLRHLYVLRRNMAGLVATMALCAVESRIFPDVYNVLRMLGLPGKEYKQYRYMREVPFDYFERVAQLAPLQVCFDRSSPDGLIIDMEYLADARRSFFMPSCLGRGELRENYYRKGLIVWCRRWITSVDMFYSHMISGQMAVRYKEYVSKRVDLMLSFYNLLTNSSKERLVQKRTDEILGAMAKKLDAAAANQHLADTCSALCDSLDELDRRWLTNDHQRSLIEWQFMSLADDARTALDAFLSEMERVEDATETELRAYGAYFLK